jgi:hypothetical protein
MDNSKTKQDLSGGCYQGGREDTRKGVYGGNILYIYMKMENMRPVETISDRRR